MRLLNAVQEDILPVTAQVLQQLTQILGRVCANPRVGRGGVAGVGLLSGDTSLGQTASGTSGVPIQTPEFSVKGPAPDPMLRAVWPRQAFLRSGNRKCALLPLQNPLFNHYLFESIATLVDSVCRNNPNATADFESLLFQPFESVLSLDVAEFHPYVFQVMDDLCAMDHRISRDTSTWSALSFARHPTAWLGGPLSYFARLLQLGTKSTRSCPLTLFARGSGIKTRADGVGMADPGAAAAVPAQRHVPRLRAALPAAHPGGRVVQARQRARPRPPHAGPFPPKRLTTAVPMHVTNPECPGNTCQQRSSFRKSLGSSHWVPVPIDAITHSGPEQDEGLKVASPLSALIALFRLRRRTCPRGVTSWPVTSSRSWVSSSTSWPTGARRRPPSNCW
jgi:hypothetical protein